MTDARLISTHAPRTGSDHSCRHRRRRQSDFNPRSPHGERQAVGRYHRRKRRISTHAPRTGSDPTTEPKKAFDPVFQPTLPARGATGSSVVHCAFRVFQPTLPARGATLSGWHCHDRRRHFNPRSPHGERRTAAAAAAQAWRISTHAPRTGSDSTAYAGCAIYGQFQPTLPARGATGSAAATRASCKISTHAPRTGSDEDVTHWFRRSWRFQPTLPARGATALGNGLLRRRLGISTHAPRTGSDGADAPCAGGAAISTHAPRTGSDA